MTETKNTGEKTLSVNPTKTLTLKRGVEQGVVRQSFSHGRSKAVVVEKVKRRALAPGARGAAIEAEEEEAPRTARRGAGAARPAPAAKAPRAGAEKRRGRLTLVTALKEDEERQRSDAAFRRRVQRLKRQVTNEPKEKLVREVTIPEAIAIQELANRMAERAVDVIRLLMKQGQMVQITDVIDADTAQLVAEEM